MGLSNEFNCDTCGYRWADTANYSACPNFSNHARILAERAKDRVKQQAETMTEEPRKESST